MECSTGDTMTAKERDKLMKKVVGVNDTSSVSLRVGEGVDDDTALTLALAPLTGGWSLLLCLLFPLQALRIARAELRRERSFSDALLYSAACLLGHFAELSGQAGFLIARLSGSGPALLEYKQD